MEPKARPRLLNPAVPARHPVVPHSACIAGPLYPGRLRRLSLRGPPTASPSQASQTRVVPHIPNPLPHPAFHRSRGLEGWKELEQLLCPNPRGVRREAQRGPQRVTGNGRNSTQQHCCLMTPSRTAHRIHVGTKAGTQLQHPHLLFRIGMAWRPHSRQPPITSVAPSLLPLLLVVSGDAQIRGRRPSSSLQIDTAKARRPPRLR